jgi:hypothetical protein
MLALFPREEQPKWTCQRKGGRSTLCAGLPTLHATATPADSAPKGRPTTAQGNALGNRAGMNAEALKGRNPGFAGFLSRPFRATDILIGPLPPQGAALGFRISPLWG